MMTDQERIGWIDCATYYRLLERWRFAPVGEPFLQGEVGEHYNKVMKQRRSEISAEEHARIRKAIDWTQPTREA